MGLFNFLTKNKKENQNKQEIDDGQLRVMTIYNTHDNLMMLVSYSSKYFDTIIDFLSGVNNTFGLLTITSHTAREIEQPENEESFDKKIVKIVDNRYYLLISGKTQYYAGLYDNLSLDNKLLIMITDEIYNNCTSPIFKKLTDYSVLDENKFKHINIAPQYDKQIEIDDDTYNDIIKHDDIKLILSKLPNSYSAIDIASLIRVQIGNQESIRLGQVIHDARTLNKDSHEGKHYRHLIKLLKKTLLDNIIFNGTIDELSSIYLPIYLKEDITYDEDDKLNGDLPIEALDEIFQQQYERVVNPLDESLEYHDTTVEILNPNEETENMRKEDIINLNDEDSDKS